MRIKLVIGLLIALTSTIIYQANPAQAETLSVISYETGYPPSYYPENDHRTGIFKDIFSAISKITKDKFVYLGLAEQQITH